MEYLLGLISGLLVKLAGQQVKSVENIPQTLPKLPNLLS
jgi:hypothetical protein